MTLIQTHNEVVLAAIVFISIVICVCLLSYLVCTRGRDRFTCGWGFFVRHRMQVKPKGLNNILAIARTKSGTDTKTENSGEGTSTTSLLSRLLRRNSSSTSSGSGSPDLEKGAEAGKETVGEMADGDGAQGSEIVLPELSALPKSGVASGEEIKPSPPSSDDLSKNDPQKNGADSCKTNSGVPSPIVDVNRTLEVGEIIPFDSKGSGEWLAILQQFPNPPASADLTTSAVPSEQDRGIAATPNTNMPASKSEDCQPLETPALEQAESFESPELPCTSTNSPSEILEPVEPAAEIEMDLEEIPSVQVSVILVQSEAQDATEISAALGTGAPIPPTKHAEDWTEHSTTGFAYL